MGIFEKVGETISVTGKDVATKAKYAGDISKLKQQIIYEEEKITDYYTELGKKYYSDNNSNQNDKYAQLCKEIETGTARIERIKQHIYSMKGVKVCKNCGAVVNDNFLFCGVCGTKLPEAAEPHVEESNSISASNNSFAFSQSK